MVPEKQYTNVTHYRHIHTSERWHPFSKWLQVKHNSGRVFQTRSWHLDQTVCALLMAWSAIGCHRGLNWGTRSTQGRYLRHRWSRTVLQEAHGRPDEQRLSTLHLTTLSYPCRSGQGATKSMNSIYWECGTIKFNSIILLEHVVKNFWSLDL